MDQEERLVERLVIKISETFLLGQDTQNDLLQQASIENSEPKPRYFIDFQWYEGNNRSFSSFAQSRLCPSCRSKLGMEVERSIPIETSSGKVVFETRKVAYGDDPLAIIKDCCSQAQDFITPNLPTMEIVFRIFLANGNQPLTLDEIEEQLEEKLAAADRPRTIPPEILQRMLDNDGYYGLRRVPAPMKAE